MAIKRKKKNLKKDLSDTIDRNIKILKLYKSKGTRKQPYKNLENKIIEQISQRGDKKKDLNKNIGILNNLARYNVGRQMGLAAPTPTQNLNSILRNQLLGGLGGSSRTNLLGITPELYNRMYNEQIQKQQEKTMPAQENTVKVAELQKDINKLIDEELKTVDITEEQKQKIIEEETNPSITGFKRIDSILNSRFTPIILETLINNPAITTLLVMGGTAGVTLLVDKIRKKIMESLFGTLIQNLRRKTPKPPESDLGGSKKDDDDDDDDGDDKPDSTPPPTMPKTQTSAPTPTSDTTQPGWFGGNTPASSTPSMFPPTTISQDATRPRWRQQKQGLDADNQRGLRPRTPQIPQPLAQNTRTQGQGQRGIYQPINYNEAVNYPATPLPNPSASTDMFELDDAERDDTENIIAEIPDPNKNKKPSDDEKNKVIKKKAPPTLPPGWEARWRNRDGRLFFVDHNTRTTHWKLPEEQPATAPIFTDPVRFISKPKDNKKDNIDKRQLEAELLDLNSQLEGFDPEEFKETSKKTLEAFKGTPREAEYRAQILEMRRIYDRRQSVMRQLGLKDINNPENNPEDFGAINLDETDILKKRFDKDEGTGGGGGDNVGMVGSINLKNTALLGLGLAGLGMGLKKGYDKLTKKGRQTAEAREANEAFAREPPFRQPSRDIFKGLEDKLQKTKENVGRLRNLREKLQRQAQGRFGGGGDPPSTSQTATLSAAATALATRESPPVMSDLMTQYADNTLPQEISEAIRDNLDSIKQLSEEQQDKLLKEMFDNYDEYTMGDMEYNNPLEDDDRVKYGRAEIEEMLDDSAGEVYRNPIDRGDTELYTADDIRGMLEEDADFVEGDFEEDLQRIINRYQPPEEREQEQKPEEEIVAGTGDK